MDQERLKRVMENVGELQKVEKSIDLLLKREEFYRATILDEMRKLVDIKKISFFFIKAACDKPCLPEGEYFVVTDEDMSLTMEMEAWAMAVYLIVQVKDTTRMPAPEVAYYISTQDKDDILIFLAKHPEFIEKYKK